MIKITFPDGATREYESGVTALDIATSISEGLARNVLAATVDGEVRDLMRPIESDATLQLHTWKDKEGKSTFWHSSAHLLAEAIEALFPGTKFGIGPAIDQGFYYDIDMGDKTLSSDDFGKIDIFLSARSIYRPVSWATYPKHGQDKGDQGHVPCWCLLERR